MSDAHTSVPGWPKCSGCGLNSVRDGGPCSICRATAAIRADGHPFTRSPADVPGAQPAWWVCAVCGEAWWRHKLYAPGSVGELEGSPPGVTAASAVTREHVLVAADARPTSVAAAQRVLPKSGSQRAAVLAELVTCGDAGATDDELAHRTGLALNSVRPRRLELVDAGMVLDSGDTRPSDQGNDAVVWLPTLAGVQWYDDELAKAVAR